MHDWIVPILFLTFFVGSWIFGWLVETRRVKGLTAFAQEHDLELLPSLGAQEFNTFLIFPFATHDGVGKVGKAFTVDNGEVKISLFDYEISTGSGKNKKARHLSLALATDRQSRWPTMKVTKHSMSSKLFARLSRKSIEVDFDPSFTLEYHISGTDPDAIRAFLTMDKLNAIRSSNFDSFEMIGSNILIEHDQKSMQPSKVRGQLASTLAFAKAMRTS